MANHSKVKINKKPIRILQVAGRMNRGGAETMLMNIYRTIDRTRVQFDFVSFNGEGEYDKEIKELGGRVFYLNRPRFTGPFGIIPGLVKIIQVNGPYAAVHAHTLYNIGIVLGAARIAGVKLRIAHSHNTQDAPTESLIRKMYHKLMRSQIIRNANCYLSCGNEAGIYLFGDIFKSEGRVIPNAIEVEKFLSVNSKSVDELQSRLSVTEGTLTLCQIGRMAEVKNHEFSIEIVKRLVANGHNIRLFFIGDGILREHLESLVQKNGLGDYVVFLGVRKDIPELLKMCDVFLMPSLFEGLPVAIVEAQAAGIECIVSSEITTEADMGLGLVKYIKLQEPVDVWAEEIIKTKAKPKIQNDEIYKAFLQKGYDVKSSALNITELYEQFKGL